MASEWARKKAEAVCKEWELLRPDDWVTASLRNLFAAALDEARAEGAESAVATAADAFAGKVAQAYKRGFEVGAERERWACHQAVTETNLPDTYSEPALEELAARIAARGPMRGPEEEK